MSIKFVRIDDRLIHGQVVTAWIKVYQARNVLIIDDGVAKDDFIKGILKMAAPSGIKLFIRSTENLNETIQKFEESKNNTIVLLKEPFTAKKLFDTCIGLRELNIGGMGSNKERKGVYKNISASIEELKVLKQLEDAGVDVYFRTIPADPKEKFSTIMNR